MPTVLAGGSSYATPTHHSWIKLYTPPRAAHTILRGCHCPIHSPTTQSTSSIHHPQPQTSTPIHRPPTQTSTPIYRLPTQTSTPIHPPPTQTSTASYRAQQFFSLRQSAPTWIS
ncbi:hypothetical protein M758_9G056300 [Ceratodon purpureus]|nr:hypothetical protein M758_9G056300 [Ceratodon purpureus]